jgi:hypothetical protein
VTCTRALRPTADENLKEGMSVLGKSDRVVHRSRFGWVTVVEPARAVTRIMLWLYGYAPCSTITALRERVFFFSFNVLLENKIALHARHGCGARVRYVVYTFGTHVRRARVGVPDRCTWARVYAEKLQRVRTSRVYVVASGSENAGGS